MGIEKMKKVGAAVIVFNPKGQILLGKHKQDGLWRLPGGKNEGEPLVETAYRELKEESGLDLPLEDFTFYSNVEDDQYLVPIYIVLTDQIPTNGEPDKFSEWVFFHYHTIPEKLFGLSRAAIDEYMLWD